MTNTPGPEGVGVESYPVSGTPGLCQYPTSLDPGLGLRDRDLDGKGERI